MKVRVSLLGIQCYSILRHRSCTFIRAMNTTEGLSRCKISLGSPLYSSNLPISLSHIVCPVLTLGLGWCNWEMAGGEHGTLFVTYYWSSFLGRNSFIWQWIGHAPSIETTWPINLLRTQRRAITSPRCSTVQRPICALLCIHTVVTIHFISSVPTEVVLLDGVAIKI